MGFKERFSGIISRVTTVREPAISDESIRAQISRIEAETDGLFVEGYVGGEMPSEVEEAIIFNNQAISSLQRQLPQDS